MFKIGDEIKLKKYDGYGDYSDHFNQIATIVKDQIPDGSLPFAIKWNDNYISYASPHNMIKVNQEWDDEENL